jgi:hypothetical protein
MDQNDKISNDKITKLENEIKVLKNEVQAVLLDLRESCLNMENPFNSIDNPTTIQPIVITDRTSASLPHPERAATENHKTEPSKSEGKPPSESPVPLVSETELPRKKKQTVSNSYPVLKSTPEKPIDLLTPNDGKLDILTVAGLVNWAEESSQKLGKERSIAVLEMSQAMGNITEETKAIVVKLIGLAPDSTIENQPRPKAFLGSLMKLNRLLSQDKLGEIALELLSMESGDTKHG